MTAACAGGLSLADGAPVDSMFFSLVVGPTTYNPVTEAWVSAYPAGNPLHDARQFFPFFAGSVLEFLTDGNIRELLSPMFGPESFDLMTARPAVDSLVWAGTGRGASVKISDAPVTYEGGDVFCRGLGATVLHPFRMVAK